MIYRGKILNKISVAHNRFHYKCCDQEPARKPTVDEIKAKSLENAQRSRKSRQQLSITPPGQLRAGFDSPESPRGFVMVKARGNGSGSSEKGKVIKVL